MLEEPAVSNGRPDPVARACVADARRSLREVRRLLMRPAGGAVAESAVHLENAANRLRDLERRLRRVDGGRQPELARELGELRRDVARASEMLENAAALYMGWARLLFAAAGGYTATGEPAAPAARQRISVEA
jgi:hypothetical protein